MTFSICLLVSENGIFASDCHLYCHRIVLSLGLLAELGGCAPTLIFNRQGQMKNDLDRNRCGLHRRWHEHKCDFLEWCNPAEPGIKSNTHTRSKDRMELCLKGSDWQVCYTLRVVKYFLVGVELHLLTNQIAIFYAALPEEQNLQDNPPRTLCVQRGQIVELPCDYCPGNLRKLYNVLWSLRKNGSESNELYHPDGLPFGDLLSIDGDTFTLTVAVARLEQTGDQFQCIVYVQPNTIEGFCILVPPLN